MGVHQQALRSTVVKKVLMALTGLVLIGFLLFHMFGNLKVFAGPAEFNYYAAWLKRDMLYPVIPHGWFIWIFRAFMLVSLVIHVYCMAVLWAASLRGRGRQYVRKNRRQQTLSSRLMRWGGLGLALLLAFHLLMFTTNTVRIGWSGVATPYDMYVGAFSNWWVVAAYALFVGVVALHVRHGFWSAFTTLGAHVGPGARAALNGLAYFVAGLLFAGFVTGPVAVLLGMVS